MCEQCKQKAKPFVGFIQFMAKAEENAIEQAVMTEHDLIVVSAVFKVIAKHGIEGAKAYFAVERKKRELLDAYRLKSDLCTKNEE